MSGIFKYTHNILPATFDKFVVAYKKKYPNVVIKYIKTEDATYAVLKGQHELAWKYDNDNYRLYTDDKLNKYFFKEGK